MRRRLLLLVTATSALLMVVLAATILPLVTSRATEDLERDLRGRVLDVAAYLLDHDPDAAEMRAHLRDAALPDGIGLGVLFPTGEIVGDGRFTGFGPLTAADRRPYTRLDLMYPRFFEDGDGDRIASQGVSNGTTAWVVEGSISRALAQRTETAIWVRITVSALVAFGVAVGGAALLARRLTRPLREAVVAAGRLAGGDRSPVVITGGPAEITALARALDALQGEIAELLSRERHRGATLSHSLRTPLTQLALDVEKLRRRSDSPADFRELSDSLRLVETTLTEIVNDYRGDAGAPDDTCDAGEVLRAHVDFWRKPADAQGRVLDAQLTGGALEIPLAAREFGICVDALISNVFRHTPPPTPFRVALTRVADDIVLTVEDAGSDRDLQRADPPSSGYGLDATRRVVEACGGSMQVRSHTPERPGTRVDLVVPLAAPRRRTAGLR